MAMAIASACAYSALVVNVGPIFDYLAIGDLESMLPLFALLFFGLLGIRVMDYYAEALSIVTANRIRQDMKDDLFAAAIRNGDSGCLERDSGEFIADFTNDITMMESKGIGGLRQLAAHIVSIVTMGGALYVIHPVMAVPVALGVALCVLVPVVTRRGTAAAMTGFLQSFDRFVQKLSDYFGGFALMKNFRAEDRFERQFRMDNRRVEEKKLAAEVRIEFINALVDGVAWVAEIAVLAIGFTASLRGEMAIGAVISAYTLAASINGPMQSMVRCYNEICSVRGVEDKLKAALTQKRREASGAAGRLDRTPDIRFQDLTVELEGKRVLDRVSCELPFGGKYLILGSNGSGKSTMMKVLKGITAIQDGSALLGGQDVRTLPAGTVNGMVSYSAEGVALLCDTIARNITLYQDIPDDAVAEAMKRAQLPLPPEKEVGDAGAYLSSGERRKVELARAFVGNAPVLIFDEVVSTLDVETAYEIERLILSIPERTVIMISNAFSGKLLPRYDGIFLMDHGRLIASGRHERLLEDSPEYRELYEIRCGGPV